jgi:hypothetical protein
MWVDERRHATAALLTGKTPRTHFTGSWWAPGPVWAGLENLAPTGIRSPDRPAGSESLYRLRFPGPLEWYDGKYKIECVTEKTDQVQ